MRSGCRGETTYRDTPHYKPYQEAPIKLPTAILYRQSASGILGTHIGGGVILEVTAGIPRMHLDSGFDGREPSRVSIYAPELGRASSLGEVSLSQFRPTGGAVGRHTLLAKGVGKRPRDVSNPARTEA